MALFNELPIPLPWYDKIEKQNRYRPNNVDDQGSELFVSSTRLIPTQFNLATSANTPTSWRVFDIDGVMVADLSTTVLKKASLDGLDTIYYKAIADLKDVDGNNIDLGCGIFYCVIVTNAKTFYSEVFQTVSAIDSNNDFIVLEWMNGTPISPVYYGDGYSNKAYFKASITTGAAVIENETESDGINVEIIVSQRLIEDFEAALGLLPYFLKRAISFMSIHSYVTFLEIYSGRFGNIYNIRLRTTDEQGKSITNTDIIFDINQVIFRNTCDGVIIPDSGDNTDDTDVLFDGIEDDGENNDNNFYIDI